MKQINGLGIPETLADLADPSRMALLVYDMQVGVVRQIADGERVTAAVAKVLDAARAAGIRVAFTRHTSLPTAWMGVTQYRMAMAWQRTDDPAAVQPWFLRGNPAVLEVLELTPRDDEAVFDKLAMSAFEGTPLAFALRDAGITAVAIVGVAMEIGIEPTTRHAADLGFIPVIVEDAIGWGHEEAARRSFDGLRFAGDAMFTTVEELTTLFGRG